MTTNHSPTSPIHPKLSRPQSLSEWEARSKKIAPKLLHSIQQGLNYQANPTDVFISPMVKCGTTWLQQIVHTLRTRGDMDFDDILEVVPWVEMAELLGQNLYAPQRGNFRAFKSHLTWQAIPKGGRYIVSFRGPLDALLSDYHFVNGYSWELDVVSLEQHAQNFMYGREGDGGWETNYWRHLVSWWQQRNNPHVLLLSYEKMKVDLPGTIEKIARFLGFDADESLHTLAVQYTSRDFMLAHQSKFSGKRLQAALAAIGYTPPSKDITMVKQVWAKPSYPESIQTEMAQRWQHIVTPTTGFTDYKQLCQALADLENGKSV